MTKPQPITPAEVAQLFVETIPDEVIHAIRLASRIRQTGI